MVLYFSVNDGSFIRIKKATINEDFTFENDKDNEVERIIFYPKEEKLLHKTTIDNKVKYYVHNTCELLVEEL